MLLISLSNSLLYIESFCATTWFPKFSLIIILLLSLDNAVSLAWETQLWNSVIIGLKPISDLNNQNLATSYDQIRIWFSD